MLLILYQIEMKVIKYAAGAVKFKDTTMSCGIPCFYLIKLCLYRRSRLYNPWYFIERLHATFHFIISS